ncbi:MAG: hypothetical protein Ct9H300mP15_10650 [Gemmatimonadota bacterium]|jgi:hypothetical protein|nr:MAG: hypothetical protein Ct9H300mP15_10650 [Gemmatimonadota bacterium]
MASLSIFGSHFAGDFFLGVDILVTSMLLNFIVMCAAVLALPHRNPKIARDVTVLQSRRLQIPIAVTGIMLLGTFLVVHLWKDMTADVSAWYLRSTPLWMVVMAIATCIYIREVRTLKRDGVDTAVLFRTLPPE